MASGFFTVLIGALFASRLTRWPLSALARAAGYGSIECYWFDTPVELCLARNAARDEARRATNRALMSPEIGWTRKSPLAWMGAGFLTFTVDGLRQGDPARRRGGSRPYRTRNEGHRYTRTHSDGPWHRFS